MLHQNLHIHLVLVVMIINYTFITCFGQYYSENILSVVGACPIALRN